MKEEEFINRLFEDHQSTQLSLSPTEVCENINQLLGLLFPDLSEKRYRNIREFRADYRAFRNGLTNILDKLCDVMEPSCEQIDLMFVQQIPYLKETLQQDAEAILAGDPAAVNLQEVIRTYPGFYALAMYRIAHILYNLKVPYIPRMLTEYSHGKTGIDIHPAAKIGKRFCIDHGTGIVIGETVEIGDDVKLYQGVTLGALSVSKKMAKTKRHPTIQDRVVIYAGATILGGQTVIGHDSIIGGSVWITKSVSPNSRIYYKASNLDKRKSDDSPEQSSQSDA